METKPILEVLFDCVLRATWQSSLLVGVVLAMQWIWGERVAPRWRFFLWLLVFVRLATPAAPESSLSIFNFANVESKRIPARAVEPVEVSSPAIQLESRVDPVRAPQPAPNPPGFGADQVSELQFQFGQTTSDVAGWQMAAKNPSRSDTACVGLVVFG
ncbi:MAG: hypothetical protein HYZ36_05670 [Pedosphaera parvula]|nr:hypothetical protein [Pedosphaera parvula]